MIPFLYNVAHTYYKIYGQQISRFTFVFPNRRAGIFFQYYLAQIANKNIFSPDIVTVSDLFERLSPYKKADRIEMLFLLYDIYRQIGRTNESFDEFLYWGEMLLNDFDDVDKYLADAKQVFGNVYDLHEIDTLFDYLSEEQIEAIKRFWSNFLPVGGNTQKKDFLEMWEVLFELYTTFRTKLKGKGRAYEGMIFREVAEETMKKDSKLEISAERIIFVGLNAHSKSEEKLLHYLQKTGKADFYWDYSSPLVCDATNKASFFIHKNRMLFPSQHSLQAEELTLDKPVLEVVGIPSAVGQAKYTHSILEKLVNEGLLNSTNKALNTAIVLPEENLLLPTLYSIPKEIDKVNVTMGYSLHNSSISGLMTHIIDLQANMRKTGYGKGFYYRPVMAILSHRYVNSTTGEEAQKLKKNIIQYNKIIVNTEELQTHPLLKKIFRPITDWKEISEYLKQMLSTLNTLMYQQTQEEKKVDSTAKSLDIEKEFIVEYYKTINKLEDVMNNITLDMSVDTYFKLLKKLIVGISVPFSGEPLSGLQIMGVLETRALDFENLILLSMNEGIFPKKRTANSFIPHNLRRGFDLPTYEHQDSIFAYHFYRMINRAKRIYLLYDTRTEGLQSGEVSRFYHQIKHLYADHFEIRESLAVYKVASNDSLEIVMQKTPQVMQKLQGFLAGGTKSLSASSINNYLNCPLQFYLSAVEGMTEEEEMAETIEASTFGTIFHSIMEDIYEPFIGRMLTADVLKKIQKDDVHLTELIEKSFAHNYFKTDKVKKLTGQNFLTGEVLRKYIKQVLQTDINIAPFTYVESEKRLQINYALPSGLTVSLKSFIDRIDEVQGHTRIIDYKTGRGVLKYKAMEELFDKDMKNRPTAVMQVFMYALLYMQDNSEKVVESGIYYLRNLFNPTFDPNVIYRPDRNDERVTDFSFYKDEFKQYFDACLDEIFNPDIPFIQTTTEEACKWCSFVNICKR